MANKIKKQKQLKKSAGLVIFGQIMEYVLAAVLFLLCCVVPLYTRDGYYQIGDAKFQAYKYIMLGGFGVLLVLLIMYGAFAAKDPVVRMAFQEQKSKGMSGVLSATDWFVIAYMAAVILSVFSGGFYREALWGYDGWYMGLMAQISFVLLYFFVSRFGRYWKAVLSVFCFVSVIVFVYGILNRLLIDPLGYYEGLTEYYKSKFLSTLGQASWYGSFVTVVLPIGITVFLYTGKRYLFLISGAFVFTGFCTLVTQNIDSAYFAMAGFMLVFFWLATENKERFLRFLWILVLFFGAGKVMYLLLQKHPNTIYDYDFVTNFVLNKKAGWFILGVLFVVCILLTVLRDKWNYPVRIMKWFRGIVFVLFGVILLGSVCLIVLKAKGMLPESLSEKLAMISYMNWDERWGNGRGATWTFTVQMFAEESFLHKFFGVGPDCYNAYASRLYQARLTQMWGDSALTNAHNEWMNMVINCGLLGAACYIGIFVSAAKRFLKKRDRDFMLVTFSACIVSYMAYNFFCYQQVLCTPFIFMIIGMGEYIIRRKKAEESNGACKS